MGYSLLGLGGITPFGTMNQARLLDSQLVCRGRTTSCEGIWEFPTNSGP